MPPVTETQQMEMDMVQGMYDSFELITENPPSYSVLLSSSPDEAAELKITITYTSTDYPESATCEVSIENVGKHNRLQVGNLNREVAAMCEENIGMHCVILILQHVQEFLVQSAAEAEKTALQRRGDEMTRAATLATAARTEGNIIAADPTIHIGTAVTRELFEEWARRHQAEKLRANSCSTVNNNNSNSEAGADVGRKDNKAMASKLTGRQLWDTTLREADWELFEAQAMADENFNDDGCIENDHNNRGVDVDFDLMAELNENNYNLDDDDDDNNNVNYDLN